MAKSLSSSAAIAGATSVTCAKVATTRQGSELSFLFFSHVGRLVAGRAFRMPPYLTMVTWFLTFQQVVASGSPAHKLWGSNRV